MIQVSADSRCAYCSPATGHGLCARHLARERLRVSHLREVAAQATEAADGSATIIAAVERGETISVSLHDENWPQDPEHDDERGSEP